MGKVDIGPHGDFPEGKGVKRDVNGIEVAVFNIDGEYFAIQNSCPHKNLPLHLAGHEVARSHQLDEDHEKELLGSVNNCGPSVNCPWHHLEWDLKDGSNRITGSQIPTFDVDEEDGRLYIEI